MYIFFILYDLALDAGDLEGIDVSNLGWLWEIFPNAQIKKIK